MSILDNIKGHRPGSEGDMSGGKFNPFKLLSIGEIMVRYTDGIRIKDFVFLAVLTSERLILIDSARQGTGQITKEIPFSVIKRADLERDEKDRPTLAISMEVGDQSRVMRLVFTGLIDEPDTECREWFTAINGFPPDRSEVPEIRLDEPAVMTPPTPPVSIRSDPGEVESPVLSPTVPVQPVSTQQVSVPPAEVKSEIPDLPPSLPQVQTPPPDPTPVSVPAIEKVTPSAQAPAQRVTVPSKKIPRKQRAPARRIPVNPVPEGAVRIFIEKPEVSSFRVPVEPAGEGGERIATSWKFCIHCGSRTPSHARFCHSCGVRQT